MDKNKTLKVELSAENPMFKSYYYATLELPAKEYEVRDALQKIRATNRADGEIFVSVLECPMLPDLVISRIDFPTIKEMEFFAERLASLDEDQQMVLQAIAPKVLRPGENDIVGIKDLINMTYGLDDVSVISNVTTDEQLGQFVIENKLHDDISAIPEQSVYLLDKSQVGKLHRENEGGVFIGNRYIVAGEYELPEIYNGTRLPVSVPTPWYAFGLQIAKPPVEEPEDTSGTAEWIHLPISKSTANKIANVHGVKHIEDCVYFDFESSVPQITSEMFGSMVDFDKLNALAEQMAVMSPTDRIKFKAALCLEKPQNIDEVLDISEHLHEYELSTEAYDADDFFKFYLAQHLPTDFDSDWLDNLVVQDQGMRLLNCLGGTETAYGMISGRGRSLTEIVGYDGKNSAELTTQKLTDEKLDVIEVCDRYALFSNGRILPEELPTGLYAYDLRQSDDGDRFCSIEKTVMVNHGGTILVKEPFDFKDADFISLNDDNDPNFLGYDLAPQEFMDTDFTQDEDESQELGGMKM